MVDIHVLHRLVNAGHSVVVAAATPEGVVTLGTHTGKALEAVLAR